MLVRMVLLHLVQFFPFVVYVRNKQVRFFRLSIWHTKYDALHKRTHEPYKIANTTVQRSRDILEALRLPAEHYERLPEALCKNKNPPV